VQTDHHAFRSAARATQLPPQTFAESLARVEALILADFDREIAQKQLYYHDRAHINAVRRRTGQLLHTLRPFLTDYSVDALERLTGLLELCANAHDAMQIFEPQEHPYAARRRAPGTSEAATFERLVAHIQRLNHALEPSSPARFTEEDVQVIREAIEATVCVYDPTDQAIYQPSLYPPARPLSLVAHLLALADIGALGIDGVAFYNQEGSLLFLEENPDTIPLIVNGALPTQRASRPDLYENVRQRLLRRARFQVSFARSRLARYPHEVACLPAASMPILTHQVFRYLTPEVVRIVETTTPTDDHTPLDVLVEFFQFEQHLKALLYG
jgi:hypothetical protein